MKARETNPVYLDYNASAPLHPAARERMLDVLERLPGNPSSPHAFGQAARDALETARARLAALLGYGRRELVFTSGGSESNTTALRWLAEAEGPRHLIASPIEHPSVLRCCEWLASRGVAVDYLPVGRDGTVRLEGLEELLRPETRLVTLMAANNETGVIQPVAELVQRVRRAESERRVLIHCDAVQAFGRIPLALREWGVDLVTIAAHKLGGPKGIGALAIREGCALPPLVLGGRQERGLRAGTESVFLAAGFLGAAEWCATHRAELAERLTGLRERLTGRLAGCEGFFQNGAEAPRLPNTANLGFAGVAAQSLLVALDLRGVAVSTGSACSSGAIEPSHVLRGMGLEAARLEASLRISLGHATTAGEIDGCAEAMLAEVARLRNRRRAAS